MKEGIDIKLSSYRLKQTSFDTIKIFQDYTFFVLLIFLISLVFGVLIVFKLINIDAPTWLGFVLIISSFAIGFLMSAKERFVIYRSAKVFVGRKMSLFGTATLSKQVRLDYEKLRARVVKRKSTKKENGKTVTTYTYVVGFVVDYKDYDFSGSSSGWNERQNCAQICQIINDFLHVS